MFIGYNLQLTESHFSGIGKTFQYYLSRGKEMLNEDKRIFEAQLKKFDVNCRLDGSGIIEEWFPKIEADIFLSHSHRDEDLAIALSAFLKENYGLKVFIDSCFWGYSNDLLKAIDNEYCRNLDLNSYCYEKRNNSTSHVHMMLSTALQTMIDKTECLIFLNTDNSISSTSDIVNSKTLSPWIFMEIETSRMIRLSVRREINYTETKSLYEGATFSEDKLELLIEYNANLDHLINLNPETLFHFDHPSKYTGLDLLYNKTLSGTDISIRLSRTILIKGER